ncbi:DUF308 domain-containing protein [Clostridium tarantellae]|uniref:HdeD family acid-resistance protein n=1 Tax=Clostridium tarantellae TaxID=39493 RepID=A0A6I1MSB3_9CLOT|nr:DUF308 domain-containing protein [Clostridium tarantellae]MPQ45082.1 hypothetical protein [Clostridium tarantellae]
MFVQVKDEIKKNARTSIIEGVIFLILGILIFCESFVSSEIFSMFVGVLILILGFYTFKHAYDVRSHIWRMIGNVLLGLLYLYVGYCFIAYPLDGILSMALFLGWGYIFIGIYELIVAAGASGIPHKGWMIFASIIDIVLGLFLVLLWPEDSIIVVSTVIAVEIMFTGIMLISLGGSALSSLKNKDN